MRGCKLIFDNLSLHTGDDLGMVQEVKSIGYPDADTYSVKVPGRNGEVNLSTAITGEVTYSNRKIELQYFIAGSRESRAITAGRLARFHGQEIRLIDDDTPDDYYSGILTLERAQNPAYDVYKITMDAYPFRRAITPTTVNKTVSTSGTLTLEYAGSPIPFKVVTTAAMTISDGVTTVTFGQAGTYEVSNFKIKPGTNTFTVTGSGSIALTYTPEVI